MKKPLQILFISFIIHSSLLITDCYSQWTRQNYPSQKQVHSIHFIDTLHGWMCAGNISTTDSAMIFYTSDGGNNWIKQYGSDSTLLYKIRFADLNTGYCAGIRLTLAGVGYSLLKTTNGGINWAWFPNPLNSDADLSDIAVINRDTIYGCSQGGFTNGIFKSTDGGQNFTRTNTTSTAKLFFTDYNHGWGISGNSFNLIRTTNAGVNWTTISNFGSNSIVDVFFIDTNTGWLTCNSAIGGNKRLLKTSNGGINWTLLDTGFVTPTLTIQYNYLFFINSQTGWCLGGTRFTGTSTKLMILKTTNSGLNWGYQDLADTSCGNHIQFTDTSHGWAYGCSGRGNYTNNSGGIIQVVGMVSYITPVSYKLYQNYPNPFNPTTKIKFNIKKTSRVRFNIFDVLGKEVAYWQSDGILTQGEYSIELDANKLNLSSGVYFYKIIVSNNHGNETFSDTKKMVLIK